MPCCLLLSALQLHYGYKLTGPMLPRGEDLPSLCRSLPESAIMFTHQHLQLLRPSPVLHLRLLIRILLQHGKMVPAKQQQQQQDGGASAQHKGAAVGLDSVALPALTSAVVAAVGSSTLAVTNLGDHTTAYPVVVVQQAFSRVFGYDPPLNFMGVENFKQLVQVGIDWCEQRVAVAAAIVCYSVGLMLSA